VVQVKEPIQDSAMYYPGVLVVLMACPEFHRRLMRVSGVPRVWRAPPSYDWSAPGLASTSEL
jgi:hypothetical protein